MSTAARIEELRKKFEENPRRYFAPLANELRKAGDLTQAIALCREHLPKQPGHMSGYIVFGQALYESGALDEARVVFEQALALDPENLIALHHLGHIARQQGDTAAARRWYERSLETDPRNDDIAHQLASLATPVRAHPAVPSPSFAPPAVAGEPTLPGERELAFLDTGYAPPRGALGAIPTPPVAQEAIGALPLAPTPDASMRAVDFDLVNASLRPHETPEPIDLADDVSPPAAPSALPEAAVTGDLEDPFRFGDVGAAAEPVSSAIVEPVDLEAAFEEGLVTAGWPEPEALSARVPTPRVTPAVRAEVPAEAAEAFGREAGERTLAGVPAPEPDVYLDEADLRPSTVTGEQVAVKDPVAPEVMEATVDAAARGDLAKVAPVDDEQGEAGVVEVVEVTETLEVAETVLVWTDADEGEPLAGTPLSAREEVDEVTAAADPQEDLPWLAASRTPVAEVTAIVQALEDDARSSGESDDVSVSFSRSHDTPVPVQALSVVDAEETSFSDVNPDGAAEEETPDTGAVRPAFGTPAAGAPAFVTETMGELLVAQGFVDRAVAVYEELVRRRPYDPVLSARLAELREQEASAAPMVLYTARERYAALATRRVLRRTPVQAPAAVDAPVLPRLTPASTAPAVPSMAPPERSVSAPSAEESLSSLFGAAPAAADDDAAQTLARAFAPQPLDVESTVGSLFGAEMPRAATPAYGTATPVAPPRQPTPRATASAEAAAPDFSFDRFFPDPAQRASDHRGSGAAADATERGSATAAAPGVPGATATPASGDDLAQFSQWLKGLGNS